MFRKIPWEGLSNLQIVSRVGHAEERLQIPEPNIVKIKLGAPSGINYDN